MSSVQARLDIEDDQLLAAVDAGEISVLVAAPADIGRAELERAVADAERELDHSLAIQGGERDV
jgi:hypothetical protein